MVGRSNTYPYSPENFLAKNPWTCPKVGSRCFISFVSYIGLPFFWLPTFRWILGGWGRKPRGNPRKRLPQRSDVEAKVAWNAVPTLGEDVRSIASLVPRHSCSRGLEPPTYYLCGKHTMRWCPMGVEPKIGGKPQNGWFISWKTLLKLMIWGAHPYFWKHPHTACSTHIINTYIYRKHNGRPFFWGVDLPLLGIYIIIYIIIYIVCLYEISYEGFAEFTCVKIIISRSLHCLALLQIWNPLSQPNQAVKKGFWWYTR